MRVLHPKLMGRKAKLLACVTAVALLVCGTAVALAARVPVQDDGPKPIFAQQSQQTPVPEREPATVPDTAESTALPAPEKPSDIPGVSGAEDDPKPEKAPLVPVSAPADENQPEAPFPREEVFATLRPSDMSGQYTYTDANGLTRRISEAALNRLVDHDYPRNSKGETYGPDLSPLVGYAPDLVGAMGTKGESGYIRSSDRMDYHLETLEEVEAYRKWQEANPGPYTIPLYDSEGSVIGEYRYGGGQQIETAWKTIEEVKESVAAGLPYDNAVYGDRDLILARGGTLLPDSDRESYAVIDGIPYKLYADKNSTEEVISIRYEYKVGNKSILHDGQLRLLDNLVNGEYPKNSKGETYGSDALCNYVGYAPDLRRARGTNGEIGYIRDADVFALPSLPAEECPHEFLVPLYDSEGAVIGKFEVGCGGHFSGGISLEEVKEALASGDL